MTSSTQASPGIKRFSSVVELSRATLQRVASVSSLFSSDHRGGRLNPFRRRSHSAHDKHGEKLENTLNQAAEAQPLDVSYCCARIKDQVNVVLELRPQDPVKHNGFGGFSSFMPEQPPTKRVPLRLVVVVDVSHSMDEVCAAPSSSRLAAHEPPGATGASPDHHRPVTKLDKVKMFLELVADSLDVDDSLSVVTFGTKAQVLVPLKKMTPDNKELVVSAVRDIEVAGVTNVAAGLLEAVDQFSTDHVKRRLFDDNIVLFTDGAANEGLVTPAEVVRELTRRLGALRDECRYDKDYGGVKVSTAGTAGFLPELLYRVGQHFSSDPYYQLDVNAPGLELDMMRPLVLRQLSAVTRVKVFVTSHGGVQLTDCSTEYEAKTANASANAPTAAPANAPTAAPELTTSKCYYVMDVAKEMSKHFVLGLKLPSKHKKLLKGKVVLTLTVQYTDVQQNKHTAEKVIKYEELPRRETSNAEEDVMLVARQTCRRMCQRGLLRAAACMKKLNRAAAKSQLEDSVNEMTAHCEYVANFLTGEEKYEQLMDYVEPLVANLTCAQTFTTDLAWPWDDSWGRLVALASSVGRELPTSSTVYAHHAELFSHNAHQLQDKLAELCGRLRDKYRGRGLDTGGLDAYLAGVKEREARMASAGYLDMHMDSSVDTKTAEEAEDSGSD